MPGIVKPWVLYADVWLSTRFWDCCLPVKSAAMWSWQNYKCPRKGNPKMPNISHCAGQAKSEGKYKKKYIYIYIYTIEGSTKICWDAGNLGLCRPSWWPFCLTVISNNFIFPSLSRDCVADCNATRRHRGKFPMLSRLFNNVFQYRIIYLSYAIPFYRNENVVLNKNQEEKQ